FGVKKSGYSSNIFSFSFSFVLHFFLKLANIVNILWMFLYPVLSVNVFLFMLEFLAHSFIRVYCFYVINHFSFFSFFFFSTFVFGVKNSGYSFNIFSFSSSFVLHLFFKLANIVHILLVFLYPKILASSFLGMLGFLANSF